jgi:hypothetical protein
MAEFQLSNGKFITLPDGTSDNDAKNIIREIESTPNSMSLPTRTEGATDNYPEAKQNSWLYDTAVVAPIEGVRKSINAQGRLVAQLGDTLGEATNIGGIYFGNGDGEFQASDLLPKYRSYKEAKELGLDNVLFGKVGQPDFINGGIKSPFYDPANPFPEDNTHTMVGSFVEGAVQFLAGYGVAGRLLKGVAPAGALTNLNRTQQFAQITTQGALADYISFDENSGRFADVVSEYFPDVADKYLSYLKSDPNDTYYEARFKNSLEGIGLGLLTEVLFKGLKSSKDYFAGKITKEQHIQDLIKIEEANKAIKNVETQLAEAPTIGEKMKIVNDNLSVVLKEEKNTIPKIVSEAEGHEIIAKLGNEELLANQQAWREGKISPEEAFTVSPKWINIDTFNDKTAVNSLKSVVTFYHTVKDNIKNLDTVLTDEMLRKEAIRKYGTDIFKTSKAYDEFIQSIKGKESLILAGDVAINSLGNALPSYIRLFREDKISKEGMYNILNVYQQFLTNREGLADFLGRGLRILGINKAEYMTELAKKTADNFFLAKDQFIKFGGGDKAFDRLLTQIETLANPSATQKVLEYALKNRFWNVANEVWVNALLSNVKTLAVNTFSTGLRTYSQPVTDMLGAWASKKIALAKGDIEMANAFAREFETAKTTLAGLHQYFGDALKYAKLSFSKGEGIISSALKTDTVQTPVIQGALGRVVRLPMRTLNASDEFFKQINYRAKLKSQAVREATDLNLKGEEFDRAVDEYMRKGFDETGLRGVNSEALKYTAENTFTDELTGITKKVSQAVEETPFLKQFLPFIKTPANIAEQVANYTGINLATDALKVTNSGRMQHLLGNSNDPRMIAKVRGELGLGSILLSSGYLLAEMGVISGATNYNGDGQTLNRFKDTELLNTKKTSTGFQPYSIKIGDTQIQFGRLDPFGAILGSMADFVSLKNYMTDTEIEKYGVDMVMHLQNIQGAKDPRALGEGFIKRAGALPLSIAQNILSKTYMQSLADVIDGLYNGIAKEDSRAFEKYFTQKAGSFIPNIYGKILNDPYIRDVNSLMDTVRQRAGIGSPVSPKYNFLGEPMEYKDSNTLRFFNGFLNPTSVSKLNKDPLVQEFLRLGSAFDALPKVQNGVDYTEFKKGNLSAYDRYNQILSTYKIGGKTMREAMTDFINPQINPEYQTYSDPIRIGKGASLTDRGKKFNELEIIYTRYKNEADAKFAQEKENYTHTDSLYNTAGKKLLSLDIAENNMINNIEVIRNRPTREQRILDQLQPIKNFGQTRNTQPQQ